LQRQVQELQGRYDALNQRFGSMQSSMSSLTSRVSALQSANNRLRTEIRSLTGDMDSNHRSTTNLGSAWTAAGNGVRRLGSDSGNAGGGIRRLSGDMDGGGNSANRMSDNFGNANRSVRNLSSSIGVLRTGMLALAPALIPIGEVALATAGGLAALGVTAGTALGAYGVAMKGAIDRTMEMDAAGKKLAPSQQAYIKATEGMTSAWEKFIIATQDKTLATATLGVQGMTNVINSLKPVVDALHPSILKVAQAWKDWTEREDGLQRFINIVIQHGVPAMNSMMNAGRDMLAVLGFAFRAFLPLVQPIAEWLEKGAASLRKWAEGGGFERFVERARQNTPAVVEALKALWEAAQKIWEVLVKLSPISLEMATNLAKFVAAIPTPVLVALVAGFVGLRMALGSVLAPLMLFRLAMGSGGLLSILGRVLPLMLKFGGVVGVFVTAVTLAWQHSQFFRDRVKELWEALQRLWEAFQPLINQLQIFWAKIEPIRQVLGQLFGFILGVGIGALTMFINFLTSLTNGLTTLWQGFNTLLSALPGVWSATWNGLQTAAQAVWTALKAAWNATIQGLTTAWTAVSGALVAAWNAVWTGMSTAVQAIWMALQAAWNAVIQAFSTAWTTVSTALQAAWNAVWTGLQTAAQAVWTAMQAAWNAVCQAFSTVWTTVSAALSAAWNAVWTGLQTAAQAIWTALQAAWNAVCQAFTTVWQAVSGALQSAWQAFWSALQTAAQAVWTALQAAWNAFLQAVQTAWQAISSALQSAWQAFWQALQTAAQAIWTALQTAWQAFLTAVQTAWTTLSTALQAAWQAFWTALQTAAQAIWTALQTAWNAFLTAVRTAWDTVSSALRTAWEAFWTALRTAAEAVWNAVRTAWQAFLDAIKEFWDRFSTAIKAAWEATWNALKETAQTIWNGIKDVVEKAVNGIIDIVKKIVGVWNSIAGAVGLDDLKIDTSGWGVNFAVGGVVEFSNGGMVGGTPAFLARGGVIPGYAPGKDTVNAVLSKGEGVLVPEAVRGLGSDFVHAANYHFSHGRGGKNVAYPGYAGGGIFGGGSAGCSGAGCRREKAAHHFAGGGCAGGNCGGKKKPSLPFAAGGITEAWHRVGGQIGWAAQGGGVVDPDPPGTPGGGTVGPGGIVTPNDDDGLSGGADLPSPGDIASGVAGVLTGGLIGDAFGTTPMVLGFIGRAAIEAAFDAVMGLLDGFGMAGDFGKLLVGGTKRLLKGMIEDLVARDEKAKEEFESMAVAGSKACQAWAPQASQAMALAGLNQMQLPAFLSLLCAESGGNPNAINNTDINAQNGVPSQGLMQVIPPTFAANHVAGTSNNILDPIANMAAAARYIMNRYGGVVPGSPYADGTDSATPGLHLVGEEGPELVGLNGPEMGAFSGGQTVLPAGPTASLLNGAMQPAALTEGAPLAGTTGETGNGLVLPEKETQELLNKGGFEGIAQAAKSMSSQVQQAWREVNTGSATQWALMRDSTMAQFVKKYGLDVPAAANLMKNTSNQAWLDMGLQSALNWALMRDTTFTESEFHQGTQMPLMATTMQTASNAAWLGMSTEATLQYTAMQDTALLPAEDHMGVQMPENGATMNTEVSASFTEMSATVVETLDTGIAKMDEFIAKAQEAIAVTAELVAAVQEAQAAMAALNAMGTPGAAGGAGGGAGGDFQAIAAEALAAAGISADQLPAFMALMQAESGGDPNAINGWDSNAAAGTPSMGLMQMIQPTFDAYNVTGGNIMDPRANMFASAAYIAARYGGVVPGSPYARGTNSATPGMHLVGENGPELVGSNGEIMAWFRGGEQVLTNEDTQSILAAAVSSTGSALIPELDKTIAAIEQFIAIAQAGIAKAKAITAAAKAAAAAGAARGAGNGSCALPSAQIIQGPYSTSVAASAGTHAGGGVYDFPADASLLSQLQANGFAAWMRGNGDGMDPHIHAVCMNAPDLSPQAAWQVQDYLAGGSGLGIPALGRGTMSSRGGWRWVGDRGPELMRTHRGDQVMPNRMSRDFVDEMSGVRGAAHDCGGGAHVEFNFNGPVNNGDDVRRAVDEAIPKLRSALQARSGTRTGR
jgi:SLT domain-containing protein/phage-related protein